MAVLIVGVLAGCSGVRLTEPAVGRPGDLPAHGGRGAATVVLRAVSPPITMLWGCLALLAGTGGRRAERAQALGPPSTWAPIAPQPPRLFQPARRSCRRHLHPLLSGVRRPRRTRRAGNDAFWPAPHHAGLLRGTRFAGRRGISHLHISQASRRQDEPGRVRASLAVDLAEAVDARGRGGPQSGRAMSSWRQDGEPGASGRRAVARRPP